MPNKPERYRLFFALRPEQELAGQIHRATQQPLSTCDGRHIPLEKLHITLVYYGSADAEQKACLEQVANTIRGRPFQLELSKLGFWPKPRVAWLASNEIPEPLVRLQSDLSQALFKECGYQAETRPYRPHLTLTRKTTRAPETKEIDPIVWPVNRFALVQSITRPEGAEYRVINEWPLY